MPYELRIDRGALEDIASFAVWLTNTAGEATARRYLTRLDNDLTGVILRGPNRFAWFRETGPPYRAKLFRLARTTYWIVYRVDDAKGIVGVLRFWNSAREPGTHGLANPPNEPSDLQ